MERIVSRKKHTENLFGNKKTHTGHSGLIRAEIYIENIEESRN